MSGRGRGRGCGGGGGRSFGGGRGGGRGDGRGGGRGGGGRFQRDEGPPAEIVGELTCDVRSPFVVSWFLRCCFRRNPSFPNGLLTPPHPS
jgi:hypothetical protein